MAETSFVGLVSAAVVASVLIWVSVTRRDVPRSRVLVLGGAALFVVALVASISLVSPGALALVARGALGLVLSGALMYLVVTNRDAIAEPRRRRLLIFGALGVLTVILFVLIELIHPSR